MNITNISFPVTGTERNLNALVASRVDRNASSTDNDISKKTANFDINHMDITNLSLLVTESDRNMDASMSCSVDRNANSSGFGNSTNNVNVDTNQMHITNMSVPMTVTERNSNAALTTSVHFNVNRSDHVNLAKNHNDKFEKYIRQPLQAWCSSCECLLFPEQTFKWPQTNEMPLWIRYSNVHDKAGLCCTWYRNIAKKTVPSISAFGTELYVPDPQQKLLSWINWKSVYWGRYKCFSLW